MITAEECLNMCLDELKMREKDLDLEVNKLEKMELDFDKIKQDPCFYIDESLEKVKNDLNLRRELVKLDFIEKVDKYYDELLAKVEQERVAKSSGFENDLKSINQLELDQIDDTMDIDDKRQTIETNLVKVKSKIDLIDSSISKLKRENLEFIPKTAHVRYFFGELIFNENIIVSRYKRDDVLEYHQGCITDLKTNENEDKIITASVDKTIKLWDSKTKRYLKEFEYKQQSYQNFKKPQNSDEFWKYSIYANSHVDCICILDKHHFATCSFDRTIKVWNIDTGECIRTWYYLTLVLKLSNHGFLISGQFSRPYFIHLWNYKDGSCVQALEGHTETIYCLEEMYDGTLISGSGDTTIKLWNEDGSCRRTLEGHSCSVFSLKVLNKNTLASGSYDKTIKIWNLESGELMRTLDENSSSINQLNRLNNDLFLSGSLDGTIKVWSLSSGKCVRSIENKQNNQNNADIFFGIKLMVNESKDILAAFSDGTVKIWKLC